MKRLSKRGVESRVSFWPLHRQTFLQTPRIERGKYPVSDRLGRSGLSLPSGNGITEEMVHFAADCLRSAVREEFR